MDLIKNFFVHARNEKKTNQTENCAKKAEEGGSVLK